MQIQALAWATDTVSIDMQKMHCLLARICSDTPGPSLPAGPMSCPQESLASAHGRTVQARTTAGLQEDRAGTTTAPLLCKFDCVGNMLDEVRWTCGQHY
jgi:hypothetical protein